MPELPEVETVRRQLDAALVGACIARVTLKRKNLRTPFPKNFAGRLAGNTILHIKRRAKYLLFYLSDGEVLIAHLGMSGKFLVESKTSAKPGKHDHVIMQFTDGRALIYNDTRRFGLMELASAVKLAEHPLLAHLGPEPLEKTFSASYLAGALAQRTGPIKTVLMDASLVVGVGNIYASEALFLAKIHPKRPAYKTIKQSASLVLAIKSVLREAVASGGSSLRDFVQISGEAGYFQHHFRVYGKAGKLCPVCGAIIRNIRLAGRSSFFCPRCQK